MTEIFVALLGEGVDVWRPVKADHLHDDVYRIHDQPYDRDVETWQFEPGSKIMCGMVDASDGPILAAIRLDET